MDSGEAAVGSGSSVTADLRFGLINVCLLLHIASFYVSLLREIYVLIPEEGAACALLGIQLGAGAFHIGDEICGIRAVVCVFEQQIGEERFEGRHRFTLFLNQRYFTGGASWHLRQSKHN
jgi:cell division protein FtsW (lipid II flippase)